MNISTLSLNQEYKKYLSVLLGAVLLSIGVTLFLVPNNIVAGGTPGLAILINYFINHQLGVIMFCINLPLVLISMKYISKSYALRTIFSICVTSFTVDFFHEILKLKGFVVDPILAAAFAGIFIGFGLGFIIRGQASAGGPSVIAKLISKKTGFKEEVILISLDAVIVILAGFVFGKIESTMLSLVTVYVSARTLDMVLSGRAVYKMVHISTIKADLIAQYIQKELGIKGIIVNGIELNLPEDKRIIMLVIENKRIIELKEIVHKYDDEGFIVISDASEIMGRGH